MGFKFFIMLGPVCREALVVQCKIMFLFPVLWLAASVLSMSPKKLVIFDLDNTLTDAFAVWQRAAVIILDNLSEQFQIDRAVLNEAYRSAPEQYRFSDFEKMVEWFDLCGHLPQAQNAQDQYRKDITKLYITGLVKKAAAEESSFYTDALETLRALKAQNVSVAVHTDAIAAPAIRSFWKMALNTTPNTTMNTGDDPHDVLGLVDHFYVRPGTQDDEDALVGIDPTFIWAMKRKTSLWCDGLQKPEPLHTQVILDDFSLMPADAVMVGDSNKDGGCARPIGVDFVWFRRGATVSAESASVLESISRPGWSYGADSILKKFDAASSPNLVVDDLRDILTQYQFASGPRHSPVEAGGALCRLHAHLSDDPVVKWSGPRTHNI